MKRSTRLKFFGFFLIFVSLAVFALTFYPVLFEEIRYHLQKPEENVAVGLKTESQEKTIIPVDSQFGIVIPKIGANSKVIADVDTQNSKEYQFALTKGVAHADGTALPGEGGNIFIFSHSSVDFYKALRYNSVFYLLNKLEKGDKLFLIYKGEIYEYKVRQKEIVNASQVQYFSGDHKQQTLTLMTCWPPGTTLKRLIVTATRSNLQEK